MLRPRTINDPAAIEEIAASGAEALAVVAFGQILREAVLSRWPSINVHFSLLPAYRGAAPVERAIMDGASGTGVTIMQMDAGLDTGPMLASRAVEIGADEDAGSLTARLSEIGGPLLAEVLDDLGRRPPAGPCRSRRRACRTRRRSRPRTGSSTSPGPPSRSPARCGRCRRTWARRWRSTGSRSRSGARARCPRPRAAPLVADEGRLVAPTGEGSLELLELQPPGRGRMEAASFLRGWRGPLEVGAAGG